MAHRSAGVIVTAALAAGSLGIASAHAQPEESAGGTITALGQMALVSNPFSDVWGWVDPATNKEYALVGEWLGSGNTRVNVHIVDCSNPTNPTRIATVKNISGFDIKTFGTYMYTCDGGVRANSTTIVDISNPFSPVVVDSIERAHNLYVDNNGLLYLSFPGLKIYNLNPDPTKPTHVKTLSTNDGHDVHVRGNILFDFHGFSGTRIYDISTPSAPVLITSITDPTISYHHSGWTSDDGNYLFLNDELAGAPTPDFTVWDITTLATPMQVDSYGDNSATIHNSFRVGNFLYVSYYTAGFRVFDITDPTNTVLADEYDTSVLSGEGFAGAWGCYPFSPSGNIYVSDEQAGLFVFSFTPNPTGIPRETPAAFVLHQNYPNPFNPTTTISYVLPASGHVTLRIYDAAGRQVRTLVNEQRPAGTQSVTWSGRNDAGGVLASGVYFYRLRVGGFEDTKRMLLLK